MLCAAQFEMKQILFFLFLLAACLGQAQKELNVQFAPITGDTSSLKITQQADTNYLLYSCAAGNVKIKYSSKDLQGLNSFLTTYNYIESDKGQPRIKVHGYLSESFVQEKFSFMTPKRGDKNDLFARHLMKLLYDSITEPAIVIALENLEQNFNFGLGIKALKEEPLTYKLYGRVSAKDVDEVYGFLYGLPKDRPVYIDMSNFVSVGVMFYETFKEVSQTHEIYWINCSAQAIYHLKKTGMRRDRIMR